MKCQVVFFLLDTQGANCVGCYRPDLSLGTPHVDRLAAEGVRFDRAYSCSPVCGPARSALMTGVYPHSAGVLANDQSLHLDVPTIGQRLQRLGASTGYIGKWHLDGTDYFGDGRCPPGWDERYWFDGRNYLESLPDAMARSLSRQVLSPEDVARHGITSEFTHAHRTADRAEQFIAEHREKDFFLVVSIDEPHHPAIAPEPFASAFEDFVFPVPNADASLAGKPRGQREWAAHTEHWEKLMVKNGDQVGLRHPHHFACNSYADSQVGRVLAAIDRDVADALVIYTADHGDMFGSHGLHGKGPCVYEEIVRVPLIMRWPGRIAPGTVVDRPVSHIDVVPTVLEVFREEVPPLLQGRSLFFSLFSLAEEVPPPVFVEFNRFEIDHDGFGAFSPIRSVIAGPLKLAVNLLDCDELYDLSRDPEERRNLIDDPAYASSRDQLHDTLLAWMNQTRDPLRGPHWRRRVWRSDAAWASSWGGATRPRPFDEEWYPRTLLYDTGTEIDRLEYEKS